VASRQLLTDEERRLLLGVPRDPDALARHYTLTRFDQELVVGRRGAANRLGFAVQLALLRHPGTGLVQMGEPVDALVTWLAAGWTSPPMLSSLPGSISSSSSAQSSSWHPTSPTGARTGFPRLILAGAVA